MPSIFLKGETIVYVLRSRTFLSILHPYFPLSNALVNSELEIALFIVWHLYLLVGAENSCPGKAKVYVLPKPYFEYYKYLHLFREPNRRDLFENRVAASICSDGRESAYSSFGIALYLVSNYGTNCVIHIEAGCFS